MEKSTHKKILNITFIALFAALCYISLMLFFFPFAQMYIHFGNLIVVTAALLIGGWQGGLAGAIGMGLYDLFNGHADSVPKTLILKFLIGLTVGAIFTFLQKRKNFPATALFISGVVSLLLAVALLILSITNSGYSGTATVLSPLFIIIGLLCIVFSLLKSRFSQKTASAIVGASCGMLVNIIGEIIGKIIQFMLAGSTFTAALSGALLAQASTLINAGVAIIGGVALYKALEKPFQKFKN